MTSGSYPTAKRSTASPWTVGAPVRVLMSLSVRPRAGPQAGSMGDPPSTSVEGLSRAYSRSTGTGARSTSPCWCLCARRPLRPCSTCIGRIRPVCARSALDVGAQATLDARARRSVPPRFSPVRVWTGSRYNKHAQTCSGTAIGDSRRGLDPGDFSVPAIFPAIFHPGDSSSRNSTLSLNGTRTETTTARVTVRSHRPRPRHARRRAGR